MAISIATVKRLGGIDLGTEEHQATSSKPIFFLRLPPGDAEAAGGDRPAGVAAARVHRSRRADGHHVRPCRCRGRPEVRGRNTNDFFQLRRRPIGHLERPGTNRGFRCWKTPSMLRRRSLGPRSRSRSTLAECEISSRQPSSSRESSLHFFGRYLLAQTGVYRFDGVWFAIEYRVLPFSPVVDVS